MTDEQREKEHKVRKEFYKEVELIKERFGFDGHELAVVMTPSINQKKGVASVFASEAALEKLLGIALHAFHSVTHQGGNAEQLQILMMQLAAFTSSKDKVKETE